MQKHFNISMIFYFVFYLSPVCATNQALQEPFILDEDSDNNGVSYRYPQSIDILSSEIDLRVHLRKAEEKIKKMEKEYSKLLLKNCQLEHRLEVCIQSLNFFIKEYQCVIREKFELSCMVSNLTQALTTNKERNDSATSQVEASIEERHIEHATPSKLGLGYFKRSWYSFVLWLGLSR